MVVTVVCVTVLQLFLGGLAQRFDGDIEVQALAVELPTMLRAGYRVDDIRAVARKYLVEKNSVTGILVPAPDQTSRGEQPAHAPVPGRS